MSRFPLWHAEENILFGLNSTRAALFRVDTISYHYLSLPDKRAWLTRLATLAYSAQADVSLYRVNRDYPADHYVEQAMAQPDAGATARHRAAPPVSICSSGLGATVVQSSTRCRSRARSVAATASSRASTSSTVRPSASFH